MRVLVADDSPTMRTIIRRTLKTLDVHEPVEAVDGVTAVEQFRQGGFDLVMTDWHMPGKTGLEVTREIRTLDPSVPIIMVTTEAERGQVVAAIEAGATDYLIKPFTAVGLEEKLLRYVSRV